MPGIATFNCVTIDSPDPVALAGFYANEFCLCRQPGDSNGD